MQVTKTQLEDTLDMLTNAFSTTTLPEEHCLSSECIDSIRTSLQDAIASFEALYKEIITAKVAINYRDFIHTLRQFRNTQMCLRVNKDRFQAQADRFYTSLRTMYLQDLERFLRAEELLEHSGCRHHINSTARSLHITAASFGICKTPKDPLLAMAIAE